MAQAEVSAPAKVSGAGLIIAICFAVSMLEGFDIQAIGLVGANLAKVAGLDKEQLGFVFAMANVGLVLGAAIGGWLADKVGRKPIFLAAVITFGLFTLATMFATDYYSLLAVRVAVGLGLGAAMGNMVAIATEVAPPGRRASTATAIFCGFPVGGGISAIFIANLPAQYDWRTLFLVGGVLPLLLAVVILVMMRETRSASAAEQAKHSGVLKALFGEGRAISTLLIWLIFFPTLMILYILLNWLPGFSADKGFAQPLMMVLGGLKLGVNASFVFNMASVLGALTLGQLVDRIGFRWPVIVALVGLFAALIGLAQAMTLPLILIYAGVAGFFLLGAQYALYSVGAVFYPDAVRGIGSGFAIGVGRIGAVFGPILAGVMLKSGFDANKTIMALLPFAAVAVVAVFLLSFRKQATD
jgi:AAHS family 3-hydroxyphenylpropionic acid transporter